MRIPYPKRREEGLTRADIIFIVVVAVLFFWLLSDVAVPYAKWRAQEINCRNNLNQISAALRDWEADHDDKYPMLVQATNGGTLGVADGNNAFINFMVMSNELSTPIVLVCPADTARVPATNFCKGFDNSHLSYLVGLDANEYYPQMILDGDRNLAVSNVPVGPGLLTVSSPDSISWTSALHRNVGNIGFADGSVSEVSDSGLQQALVLSTNGTPFASTRLAIP